MSAPPQEITHRFITLFPGRSAARSGALQTRDRYELRVYDGPGSAVHHFVLHRIRETLFVFSPARRALLQKGPNTFLRRVRRHDVAEILDRVRNPAPIVILAHEG